MQKDEPRDQLQDTGHPRAPPQQPESLSPTDQTSSSRDPSTEDGLILDTDPTPDNPVDRANWLSRITWRWLNPIVAAGQDLERSDLLGLSDWQRSENVNARAEALWERERSTGRKSLVSVWMKLFGVRLVSSHLLLPFLLRLDFSPCPPLSSFRGGILFPFHHYILFCILSVHPYPCLTISSHPSSISIFR